MTATLLDEALDLIDDLIPRQGITIVTETSEMVNGFPQTTEDELETIAHIQPLTPFEVKKLTESVTGSNEYYRFWIVGDLAQVKTFVNNESTVIEWNGKEYKIFSKSDWSLNGWIEVIGTLEGVENV